MQVILANTSVLREASVKLTRKHNLTNASDMIIINPDHNCPRFLKQRAY